MNFFTAASEKTKKDPFLKAGMMITFNYSFIQSINSIILDDDDDNNK